MDISEETFQKALRVMEQCERIICTDVPVGSCNMRLGQLIEAAKRAERWLGAEGEFSEAVVYRT